MSDITMDCDKCQEFQYMKGRVDVIERLKDIICQRKCGECEWVTCPFEEVKENNNDNN